MSAAAFTAEQRDGVLEIFIELKTLKGHRLTKRECWQDTCLVYFWSVGLLLMYLFPEMQ